MYSKSEIERKEAFKYASLFNPNQSNTKLFDIHKNKMGKKLEEFKKREKNEKGEIFVEGLGRVK